MRHFACILLFLCQSCCETKFVVEKPKLQPSAIYNPNFDAYALTFKIKWDIVQK